MNVMAARRESEADILYATRTRDDIVEKIHKTIKQYLRYSDVGYEEGLYGIVDAALKLDEKLSRQVAQVCFIFNSGSTRRLFDKELMDLDNGEKRDFKLAPEILLTVAPLVLKRGKSNGDDFQEKTTLLKPIVSCTWEDS